jgi:hypothetical protein
MGVKAPWKRTWPTASLSRRRWPRVCWCSRRNAYPRLKRLFVMFQCISVRAVRVDSHRVAGWHIERPHNAVRCEADLDGRIDLSLYHLLHNEASEAFPFRWRDRRSVALLPYQPKIVRRYATFMETPMYGDFSRRSGALPPRICSGHTFILRLSCGPAELSP